MHACTRKSALVCFLFIFSFTVHSIYIYICRCTLFFLPLILSKLFCLYLKGLLCCTCRKTHLKTICVSYHQLGDSQHYTENVTKLGVVAEVLDLNSKGEYASKYQDGDSSPNFGSSTSTDSTKDEPLSPECSCKSTLH